MRYLYFTLFSLLLFSCENSKTITIYSLDKQESIDIKINRIRNRLNVYHSKENEAILSLDISGIEWGIRDDLHLLWKNDGGWDMVVRDAKILTINLDTLKYSFSDKLPVDSLGIPREKKFRTNNGVILSLENYRVSPPNSNVLVIVD